ncbi:protein of unknown function [Legionella fallonii LLAP-10]|uniref:Uncharacterized protein n=1 Tax=Legionella fallonii LLAP-10 TaxID=1212491 RepID=A0A098G833_9GAMM|nr:protein of unknown function [Legionella fallonii LLAP-10]
MCLNTVATFILKMSIFQEMEHYIPLIYRDLSNANKSYLEVAKHHEQE